MELSYETQAKIIGKAQNPMFFNCNHVDCNTCALHHLLCLGSMGGRGITINYWVHTRASDYINNHPEQFTVELITEVFL